MRSTPFLAPLVFGVLVLPLFALDPSRNLDQFSYQSWQTGSGLPQNSVHSILQSHDGFLWLATEGGLVRFDGYQFAVFDSRNTPALGSNIIRALLEDAQGTLWIATSRALCRRKNNRIDSVAEEPDILALAPDSAGGFWAVTADILERWSLDSAQPRERYSLPERAARFTGALASSQNGDLWLGTTAGLELWRKGTLSNVVANLPAARVESLLLDHSSTLWAGTAAGVFRSIATDPRAFRSVCSGMKLAGISALFEDWERSIWIGGEDGPYRFDSSTNSCQPARTLAGLPVLSFTEDAEGDLWIGTESAGATLIRNQKFVTYTTREGLTSDTVRSVFADRGGAVYAGTDNGLTRLENGHFTGITTASGLASNVVLSLGENKNGLLIGTPDGLDRFHAGKFSLTTSADGLPDDFVRSIYTDRDGSLWIGTRHGLSHESVDGSFATFTTDSGLGSDLVGAVLRDRQGSLWVATLDGLSVLQGARFRTFRASDGLSSNTITALHDDHAGDLWIGTRDAGLNLLSRSKVFALSRTLGLPDDIYGIAEDSNGELWLPSRNGIARVNREELKKVAEGEASELNVVWYTTADGLRVNECSIGGHPEVWKAPDGTLWFSTMKGLAALSPTAAHLNRVLPPVVIESVRVSGQPVAPNDLQDVKPGHSRFAFEYAALSFAAPQKIIYRYQLEGFDKNWINAGTQRVAYYTNIPPGHYRFRVIARNGDGFWNEAGAQVSFRLEPQFYQTLWFYALCALALVLCSYGAYRWRVAEIEGRFRAVLEERNRIGREIHDTLAQSFVAVSMQLEIAARLLSTSTDTARQHLDQARLQVREGLLEARRSIWQLRSESAGSEDLAARISKATQQAIGLQPVKLTFEVKGPYRPLLPQVENELFRISQEAVNNALRHAAPNRIVIELSYAPGDLKMEVTDDGCGFDPAALEHLNGHFGVQGMRERAAQIRAKLNVESAPGKGTKVLVEVPLNS